MIQDFITEEEEPHAKPSANDLPTELDELVGRDQETEVGGS